MALKAIIAFDEHSSTCEEGFVSLRIDGNLIEKIHCSAGSLIEFELPLEMRSMLSRNVTHSISLEFSGMFMCQSNQSRQTIPRRVVDASYINTRMRSFFQHSEKTNAKTAIKRVCAATNEKSLIFFCVTTSVTGGVSLKLVIFFRFGYRNFHQVLLHIHVCVDVLAF